MDRHEWDARYAQDGLVWSAEPNRFLAPEVRDLPPGRALDVACGEGRNAIWLAEQGWEVTGVDFSSVAIEKATRLAEGRGVTGTWRVLDVVEDPLGTEEYDLALLFYLQLPAGERRRAVQSTLDALRPGGTILVVGHDSSNIAQGWGGPQDPTVLYAPDDLVADMDGRVEIERAERVERPVETEDGVRVAIDALVRARKSGS
jgi:SAM-dependent methyltransferase